jgi:hypothetical protein
VTVSGVRLEASALARAHGVFNVLGGLWPLVSMRSFEAVLGPKVDHWLVRTVAGLMVTNGAVQLMAEGPDGLRAARRLGIGTALTLGAIDAVYAPKGRISRVYLLDGLFQWGWVLAWVRARPVR